VPNIPAVGKKKKKAGEENEVEKIINYSIFLRSQNSEFKGSAYPESHIKNKCRQHDLLLQKFKS
jgi:hypothetical protein